MSTITLKRSHTMTPDRLREVVQALADKLVDKFGGSAGWQGDEIHYDYSGGLKACVACTPGEVVVDVQLKGVMSIFRDRIASEMEEYLQRHIS